MLWPSLGVYSASNKQKPTHKPMLIAWAFFMPSPYQKNIPSPSMGPSPSPSKYPVKSLIYLYPYHPMPIHYALHMGNPHKCESIPHSCSMKHGPSIMQWAESLMPIHSIHSLMLIMGHPIPIPSLSIPIRWIPMDPDGSSSHGPGIPGRWVTVADGSWTVGDGG